MNKAEMIDALTDTLGDKRTATTAVEAVLATVLRTVSTGEKVSVPGFGVFEKVDRAARTARNPATGAAVELEATSVPRFRPAQRFKDVVRGAAQVPDLPDLPPRPAAEAATAAPPVPVPAKAMAPQPAPTPTPTPTSTAPASTAPAPSQQSARAGTQGGATADKAGPRIGSRTADKTPTKKRDGKKADGKKADGKKADGKKADGKKADGKKADGKKADGKKADGKKADGKKAKKK